MSWISMEPNRSFFLLRLLFRENEEREEEEEEEKEEGEDSLQVSLMMIV
jgi:hypothetical protein